MNKEQAQERAKEYFAGGYNCAEATLLIMQDYYGMEHTPHLASGFGGGMGRCSLTCGALTGGILALDLKFGRHSLDDPKEQAYDPVNEFVRRFREELGTHVCKELTGYDLSTEEGLQGFKDDNVHDDVCSGFVAAAVGILIDIVESG